jgi:hypothetical protein
VEEQIVEENLAIAVNDDKNSVDKVADKVAVDKANKVDRNVKNTVKKLTTKQIVLISVIAVLVIAIITAIVLVVRSYNWTSGNLDKITAYKAKTLNEISGQNSQHSFKVGEPILLKLDITPQKDSNIGIRWELIGADSEVVKRSALPISSSPEKSNQYIALATSTKAALPAGDYVMKFYTDTQTEKQIGQYKISITE